jgi:hypothetical protein
MIEMFHPGGAEPRRALRPTTMRCEWTARLAVRGGARRLRDCAFRPAAQTFFSAAPDF